MKYMQIPARWTQTLVGHQTLYKEAKRRVLCSTFNWFKLVNNLLNRFLLSSAACAAVWGWIYCFLPGAHNKLIPGQVKGELGVISHPRVGKSGDPRTESWDTHREKNISQELLPAEVLLKWRDFERKQATEGDGDLFIGSRMRKIVQAAASGGKVVKTTE